MLCFLRKLWHSQTNRSPRKVTDFQFLFPCIWMRAVAAQRGNSQGQIKSRIIFLGRNAGVPQGSRLGPRLINIHISIFPDACREADIQMYVNDTYHITTWCILVQEMTKKQAASWESDNRCMATCQGHTIYLTLKWINQLIDWLCLIRKIQFYHCIKQQFCLPKITHFKTHFNVKIGREEGQVDRHRR